MLISRRNTLALVGAAALSPALGSAADTINPFGVRAAGNPDAQLKVIEYFSMGCPHCAEFAIHTLPKIIAAYVKTGKLYYIFRDFPLDTVSVMAAAVARSLPESRYVAFNEMLFSHQYDWAYNPKLKTLPEYHDALFKFAALAGMDRASFNAAVSSVPLQKFIIGERKHAEKTYKVDATPTFIFKGKKHPGAVDFKQFSSMIGEA
jgi:protein-disulfide isomerase